MLLALPFRYRYEINFARKAMPGRSRGALETYSLRVRPFGVSSRSQPSRSRHHVYVGLGRTDVNGMQTANLYATLGLWAKPPTFVVVSW